SCGLALLLCLRLSGHLRIRLAERIGLFEYPLQRLDEALRIGAETFMRQPHGVPPGQRSDRFRQLLRARHVRVTHEHWNHPLVLLQGRFNLDADEILGIIKTAGALLVTSVNPAFADHGEQRIAPPDLLFQHPDEVETRRDVIDVHEQLIGRKRLLQPVKQAAGIARVVAAAIVDEYVTGHVALAGLKKMATQSSTNRADAEATETAGLCPF